MTPLKKPFLQDPSRLQFGFGLVTGIAVLSTVGFFLLLAKVNGSSTSPVKNTNSVAAANTAAAPTAVAPTQPTGPVTLAEITKDDHIRGTFDAPVTIVEFSDIQCPFCNQFHPTLQKILADYPDKVRWVYKHFPLDSIHPMARSAALASECANEQGKFWEFLDQSFTNQQLLGPAFYTDTAKSLGLNESKFKDCVDTQKFATVIDTHTSEGNDAGVTGTPSTFINGTPVSGAQPYASVKAVIDAAIAKG